MLDKAISLTFINLIGRLINFVLFIVIANKFGATASTDWFFFNYGIVYFFTGVLFNASEYTLVPIWNKTIESDHKSIFAQLLGYKKIISFTTIIIIFLSSFIISPLLGVKIPDINLKTLIIICIILGAQPTLAYSASIFSSYLQYKRKYILPTIHLTIRSIGILPIILYNDCNNIFCLAASFLFGEALRLTFLYKKKFIASDNTLIPKDQTATISHIARSTVWMSAALSLIVANPLIDIAMVGMLDEGSVSLVEYAGRLRGLPALAFNGVLILLLGEWSNQHLKTSSKLKWENISGYLYFSILLASLFSLILIFSVDKWITVVFFSSKFTNTDITYLKNLLTIYLIGLPMLIGTFILTRIIIIFQQYRVFTAITFTGFSMNILLNYVFIRSHGLIGVALSTTLVDCLMMVALFALCKKMLK